METFRFEIVTAEASVFTDDVQEVILWGTEGQMTILPKHASLMTMLAPGDIYIKSKEGEQYLAESGGFLEVRSDKVILLADACERVEDIDEDRAEAAKKRAEETLKASPAHPDAVIAEAALRRSLARLKVVEKRRYKKKAAS